MMSGSRQPLSLRLLTYGLAGALALFSAAPIVWLILTSFKREDDIVTAAGVTYLPKTVTLQNYVQLWQQTDFPTLFANTLQCAFGTILLCLAAGLPAAYVIAREQFPGRRAILVLLLLIRIFPAVMLIVPIFMLLRAAGLLDTLLGLSAVYAGLLLPIFIWLLKCFFDEVPRELEEAARIDGCSRLGAVRHVTVPLVRAGVVATCALIGISAANEFLFALILTSSDRSRTWPVGLQMLVGDFQLPWGPLAAGGVLSIMPVFLALLFMERSTLRRLAEASLKRDEE